ncbi:amino acid adenylation domain-containing protein [Streptomyces albus subsp. chlorinus]|uniref:amino acid adenylation domain-containing protein n=1 Tax=Streptomyces albus TaxID=1888 RepID=UPI00156FC9D9|nr:amino acid adenylation domain-containing protein [Streptomyces albus]NSC20090.1 amino acid adenylation domain-containing protein [Streptomyces albus subsp. chlorinus]
MNDTGRLCQALAVRLHQGAGTEQLRARLDAYGGGARLWVEHIDEAADGPRAVARRESELSRPADPRTGPGLRAVLLRYADGLRDLVVVAHRAVLPEPCELVRRLLGEQPSGPEGATGAASGGRAGRSAASPEESTARQERLRAALDDLDRVPAPDWGLGTDGAGTVGAHRFRVASGGQAPAEATLRAALGLVLARCTGRAEVVIGLDAGTVVAFSAEGTQSVAAYLEQVAGARPAEGLSPVVGLLTTRAADALTGDGVKAEPFAVRPFLAPPHALSLHIADDGSTVLEGRCAYRHAAFADAAAEWFTGMLATAHRALLTADPATPVGELPLFDEEQRSALARLGGLGRRREVPGERIEETVGRRAAAAPDALALTFGDQRLTYRQLEERAGRFAARLRELGVAPGDRVGVCLDRSADLVVTLLAVLRTGAAYVPMDPAYPAERLAYTTEDAGVFLVVTEAAQFPEREGLRLVSPAALDRPAASPGPAPAGLSADDAAYVIYTSGSTGRPKGVVVPHRNVAALLAATEDDFGLGERDVWTLFHSSAFDFSVWEIWGCLMTGGRLVVVPYWASRDPARFAGLLESERVTVLSQTPSAFAQLMARDRERGLDGAVRLVVFGGEPLDTRPLRFWLDRHPERECRLVNMFGITETTVHVTAQTVTRSEALTGSRSVGRPLPGWHVYVLDPEGRPLPPGVAGEIHVGGAGVAGSYLNRPELTAQRFLPDPHVRGPMYRSGDRGRLLPDGRLEHLGRLDNQVKLRGFRIELDEIRARLLEAPGVTAAAVVLRQGQDGDTAAARLDAYVVFGTAAAHPPHGTDGTDGGEDGTARVRRHAARFLPEHMVPATVTVLPALPLTPNGKVDTGRLPLPLTGPSDAGEEGEPAGDDVESRLRAVWEKVFGFRVGLDDDFFSLGGNSLLGVRLLAGLKAAGLPAFPLPQLYLHRTVRQLAPVLAGPEVPA